MISEVDRAHKARKKGVPLDRVCRYCGRVKIDGLDCCTEQIEKKKAEKHPDIMHRLEKDELTELLENTERGSRRHTAALSELENRWEFEEKYDLEE